MNSTAQHTDTEEELELEEVVYYISSHLNETKTRPLAQIRQIVTILGPEKSLRFLKQAREIDKGEGMVSISGKKRRTVGGVFFTLVKTQCDAYTVALIWPDGNKETATRGSQHNGKS